MKKHWPLLLAVFTVALTYAGIAWAQSARSGQWNTGQMFSRFNGEHIHRFTLTPDNSTAEDNTSAAGNSSAGSGSVAAVTYTLTGQERICCEATGTDAWLEPIAAASMTAAGAKGRLIKADQSGDVVCESFKAATAAPKLSALCTAAGPCLVKCFEVF